MLTHRGVFIVFIALILVDCLWKNFFTSFHLEKTNGKGRFWLMLLEASVLRRFYPAYVRFVRYAVILCCFILLSQEFQLVMQDCLVATLSVVVRYCFTFSW